MSGLHEYQEQLYANQRAARVYIARIGRIVDAIEQALALGHDPRLCPYVAAVEAGCAFPEASRCDECPAPPADMHPSPPAPKP
jgi:hypothetical protein